MGTKDLLLESVISFLESNWQDFLTHLEVEEGWDEEQVEERGERILARLKQAAGRM